MASLVIRESEVHWLVRYKPAGPDKFEKSKSLMRLTGHDSEKRAEKMIEKAEDTDLGFRCNPWCLSKTKTASRMKGAPVGDKVSREEPMSSW